LKHIATIKEPWRRSNHYNAIGQMLQSNQWLNKLAASRVDFKACGMLTASLYPFGSACVNSNFGSLADIAFSQIKEPMQLYLPYHPLNQ